MSTLSNIRNCLYSSEPQLFDLPAEFPVPSDPVSWSHSVCTAHPGAISVEAMPQTIGVVVEDPGRAVTLASDAAPELVRKVLTGISRGAAAHALMPLWHADSFVERVADQAVVPFKDFVVEYLGARLQELHPVGYYTKLTLWFSADKHLYAAHCDVADGLLFQLTGEKVVEVWPVPRERGTSPLFDHAYGTDRMTAPGRTFKVSAGQALFIPGGAMHEVVVASNQVSVSMSLHMGSPFPIIELCRDLNHMGDHGCTFELSEEMMQKNKFRVFYFEPAMFHSEHAQSRMPDTLSEALLNVLIRPQGCSRERTNELLDVWWRNAVITPRYPGPYPHPDGLPT